MTMTRRITGGETNAESSENENETNISLERSKKPKNGGLGTIIAAT